ncbi:MULTISPECIES: cytochrome-c oxidase, cbb3-type subunit III [unclassified Novosphingobium]|uniref:cytochrome-c oxidase, cbb3-type subunit III n=1 Tax=unclassified Novosphingobium TaxID=2644732 RepID=UPI00086B6D5B|nr:MULTISPECIES: cytochrome-c oxidase, cbb3-type subunit III [unclassified Novosphingobium]MBN9143249.1 cytochrome-c oxidase, cbb3-type subunit III [Novosphingobium sp.]MDR6706337.1 cytochrome c oxidase cbb3-type subunit 3 [Novosphingobium sp. 1748]ODU82664.1 MAG: cytochrome-c oxidase, cbb3-type subunit III [Novosphingobium sp. SCN 63-17]OJX89566.1 MAG: cytochrome-c oxidase, cbb3-type subunit III [Novosphingobium sp. 63-713]
MSAPENEHAKEHGGPRVDEPTGTATMGHEWDGIEELNTPLPTWWLYTFYACIVFAIGYCVVYPAIPGIKEGSHGTFGWTSRGQLASEMDAAKAARAPVLAALDATPIEDLPKNPELLAKAVAGGKAAFKVNCVPCHGSGAAGSIGYPNLNDDDWLWGGTLTDIQTTLEHGIRQPGDDATRTSMMPSFGRDGILKPADVQDVVSYVRQISGQEPGNASAQRGAALFAANCVACHNPDGKGNRMFGAPNLTDKVWLYGGSRTAITETVTNAHAGVMPAWGNRLSPATIKMLAAYVHSLGGGEAFAAPAAPAAETAASTGQ